MSMPAGVSLIMHESTWNKSLQCMHGIDSASLSHRGLVGTTGSAWDGFVRMDTISSNYPSNLLVISKVSNLLHRSSIMYTCSHSLAPRLRHMLYADGTIEWWLEHACRRVFYKKYFFVPNGANHIWVYY